MTTSSRAATTQSAVSGRRAGNDAYALALELGVVQALDTIQGTALGIEDSVGRTVVVIGIEYQFVTLRITEHHIAGFREQCPTNEAGGLREPRVLDADAQRITDDIGNLVLEAFTLLVRERQIGRVGTYAKHAAIDEIGLLTFDGRGGKRPAEANEDR